MSKKIIRSFFSVFTDTEKQYDTDYAQYKCSKCACV